MKEEIKKRIKELEEENEYKYNSREEKERNLERIELLERLEDAMGYEYHFF